MRTLPPAALCLIWIGAAAAAEPEKIGDEVRKKAYESALKHAEARSKKQDFNASTIRATHFGPLLLEFKVDAFGTVGGTQKVLKVVDEKSAVMQLRLPAPIGPKPVAVPKQPTARVFVSGVDTAKWADNMGAELPPVVFVIVGNKKLDGETLLHLAPIQYTQAEEKAILEAAKVEKK